MEMDEISGSPPSPSSSSPHGALYLVLAHLPLRDLLSFQIVCTSFRDAINTDPLLWRHVTIAAPIAFALTDHALVTMTSRADGTLVSLSLSDCTRITDAALLRVARANPRITKLYVPGCTNLTGDGIVRVVRWLAERKGNIERLQLYGVRSIRREHLKILNSLLKKTRDDNVQEPVYYGSWSQNGDDGRQIDVEVCPKCRNIRPVFDCTREECRTMEKRWTECRGCFFCIARCEDCGVCINYEEIGEETACSHLLCLECWLQLPKCNMCNRPYCNKHGEDTYPVGSCNDFVCDECAQPSIDMDEDI